MDIKQIRAKKSMKLLFLLLTALVIGAASATTYSYLYMNGTVTVGSQQLVWIKGSGAPSGTTISGSTVTIGFNVQTAIPQNFTYVLYLKNLDTATHNVTISVTTALPSADFTYAKMYTYDSNSTGSFLHTFDLTTINHYMFPSSMSNLDVYRMDFGINATAASGSYTFNMQVLYQ
ncbi:MAG TPA: hypothetical protein VMT26_00900 [Candidatus Bathyarchaeia archaeon]|jgi:hypothetical protein|nr:hypothetical protein [Candidatus Bathyarchaeia archaeon]